MPPRRACLLVSLAFMQLCVKVSLWKEICLTSIDVENQHKEMQNMNCLCKEAAEESFVHLHITLLGQSYTNKKFKVD